jgi:hypothetical protein
MLAFRKPVSCLSGPAAVVALVLLGVIAFVLLSSAFAGFSSPAVTVEVSASDTLAGDWDSITVLCPPLRAEALASGVSALSRDEKHDAFVSASSSQRASSPSSSKKPLESTVECRFLPGSFEEQCRYRNVCFDGFSLIFLGGVDERRRYLTDPVLSRKVKPGPFPDSLENSDSVVSGREFRLHVPYGFNSELAALLPWGPFSSLGVVRFINTSEVERFAGAEPRRIGEEDSLTTLHRRRNVTWLRGGSYLILGEGIYRHLYHDFTAFGPLWDARTSGNADRWYPPVDNVFLNRPAPEIPWMKDIFEVILHGEASSNNVAHSLNSGASSEWDFAKRLDGNERIFSRSVDNTRLIMPDDSTRVRIFFY